MFSLVFSGKQTLWFFTNMNGTVHYNKDVDKLDADIAVWLCWFSTLHSALLDSGRKIFNWIENSNGNQWNYCA